jgi:hypothetical protein
MDERVSLTGWRAAAVAAVILGIVVIQCVARIQKVDEPAREIMRAWFVREYQGKGIRREVQEYLERKAGRPVSAAPPVIAEPMVRFASYTGHGSNDMMTVRVEVRVNEELPPDGRAVRYVDLMRQDGRWMVFAESDALHYYWMLVIPAFRRNL